ncbi:MAG TPA: protein kinase, partial [Blastocatellia bacterium]|nr:protein kinase [Blastocatellia bacterium]
MEEQLPHTNLSHYRIVSKIGAGGMGEVYLAEDLRLRRKVALKVLPEEIAADADRLRRFEREAQSASALNHPNIVTVHEFGVESGIHFLVMELVEGATLREKIKSDELALEEILDIAQQAAFALSAAHSAAIIHRDLKPENIMLRRDGIVKVLDFGLAKLAAPVVGNVDSEEKTLVQITNQTSHGVVVGTLQYMSPEQVRGQPLDARSDIFSLGVVLYEMLAGKRPFDKPTSIDVIAAILTETPPPVSHERHAITPELQRIVSKALNKDRDERYQSSKELLDDLKSLREEVKISASPKRVASKEQAHHSEVERPLMKVTAVRRFSRLSVLAILSLAGLAIVFVAWLIFKSTSRPITIYPSALETAVVANWQSSPGELYSVGSFSPDGKEIAFTSTKIGSKNIWIKRLLGEEAVQVTKDEFANQSPIWAPNGDEIAFYSIRGGT